ncbi:MAG: hypothetical protein HY683_09740 [Chloroflexi bacterium]|nr:hypothetical protein [Chloroflexota bacterium]
MPELNTIDAGMSSAHRGSELEYARHFMQWVTTWQPARIARLDQKSNRARPDFAFYYQAGQHYTLELTAWLTPQLKGFQNFLQEKISQALTDRLPGTFALYISFGRLTPAQAQTLIAEIEQIAGSQVDQSSYRLSTGALVKVRDDGHRLVPVITLPEIVDLDEGSGMAMVLKAKLTRILNEAKRKFRYYRGIRVLLLDISQNGLDIDYHGGISAEGPGIIRRWISSILLGRSAEIHYVCVSQGVRVWEGSSFDRMLTGHRYEGKPAPNYREVWRRPGLPAILQSFVRPPDTTFANAVARGSQPDLPS